ncbi:MAG TPA: hypothetical protein VGJ32_00025 [Solirubrobacteraceae bacterium]|jgi:heme-degrading monooxygenase HmoA
MLCALTVRKLKPGTFEQFREAFMRDEVADNPPAGWVRFNMIRNADDPDEVICFGFFDGSVDELRRSADETGYREQQEAIAPFVESVGADGLYEIVEDYTAAPSTTG